MLEKCVLTIVFEPALRRWQDKIENLSSYTHFVHTTAKQVISRRRKNENIFKISKNACKSTVSHCHICKFVGGFSCRRRRRCSTWRNATTCKHEHAQNPRLRKNYCTSGVASSSRGAITTLIRTLSIRKALDNIDLNLVSHRYVSGVLKDDHFVSARSLAPRFWSIAARIVSAIKRSIYRPFQFILLKSCSIRNGF